MKRSVSAIAISAAAIAVAGPAAGAAASHPASAAQPASVAKVELVNTKLGKVLADGRGRTLYLFEKDKSSKSECAGMCAQAWPPLTTTGKPHAGAGVSASKLGTTTGFGGVKQVTYNGHPLYGFVKDTGPRQTHGEGLKAFGAEWYVLNGAGRKVEEHGS
jgi:predicted lipoprotein with Yx(FWY)xxD motif